MNGGSMPDNRTNAQLTSEQLAANDRAALMTFITFRSMHLAQGVICLATGWKAYRRPRLALAILAALAGESAWLVRRCWSRKTYEGTMPALVDTGAGLLGLGAIAIATAEEDRTAWLNWVCPLTFGTAAGVAMAAGPPVSTYTTTALAGTYVVTVWSNIRLGGSQLATALANTSSYFNYYWAATRLIRRLSADAEDLEVMRAEMLLARENAAAESERNKQHRMLHDSALQTLEAVARGHDIDHDAMRRQAQREATTLRRAISGEIHRAEGLLVGLEAIADDFADRGLRIELVTAELDLDPQPALSEALCDAAQEALTNVLKHAGVSGALMRASADGNRVTLMIRDRGCGFDTLKIGDGFGIPSSIIGRLKDVGGGAEVSSEIGIGTRVDLWAPT
jgi:signal transduction histidine kinase